MDTLTDNHCDFSQIAGLLVTWPFSQAHISPMLLTQRLLFTPSAPLFFFLQVEPLTQMKGNHTGNFHSDATLTLLAPTVSMNL